MAETDGPGDQNPFTFMLEQALDSLLRQAMFTLPGRVTAFDPATQLASVECGIQRVVNGRGMTIPVIENVPVCFAGDNQWYFFHQITPGETEGLIHFSQRAIDTWIDQGGPVAPHDLRILSEKDAFFVPGVRSQPGAIPNFKNDGAGLSDYDGTNYLHFKASGDVEAECTGNANVTVGGDLISTVGGDLDSTVTGDVITSAEGSITATAPAITLDGPTTINGGLQVNGDAVADGISLKSHTHTQPSDGAGDSESPTDPPS